ncbi:MAG: 16S rRNA (guanine(527)-N(7))-methyltransferase RsmG [Nocardioides sp.]
MRQYARMLADDAVDRGLIGPRERPRLWDRHILNSLVLTELLDPDWKVCDIGSGAGLPGLVVAIARPDLMVTLLEPMLRRTTFLEECIARLGMDNVAVMRARADGVTRADSQFDAVISRAVAPVGQLARWSVPLLRPGGVMLALKGSSAHQELESARVELVNEDCHSPEVLSLTQADGVSTTSVIRLHRNTREG